MTDTAIDNFIRDVTRATPMPKSIVRERLQELIDEQVVAELEKIRHDGTYFKREVGFAPGLWLKVDIIDERIKVLNS